MHQFQLLEIWEEIINPVIASKYHNDLVSNLLILTFD